ncbi:MAG: hypothetical protein HC869_09530 [Rhodospirillales bacterium]|nr:hypothetical protein [Rhodospirillales bacterium]
MDNAIADRVWLARDRVRREGKTLRYTSVSKVSGVTLTDIRDVANAVADVGDLLDDLIPAVFWAENGYSSGLPGGLVCQDGAVEFLLYNAVRVPLLGGITPELLVRLLASELGYTAQTVIAVTLFINPACALPEGVLSQLDQGFALRVMQERRKPWPRIFPQDYYRDDRGQVRDRCAPWAMCAGVPVRLTGPEPLDGCNIFLRRCQHVPLRF